MKIKIKSSDLHKIIYIIYMFFVIRIPKSVFDIGHDDIFMYVFAFFSVFMLIKKQELSSEFFEGITSFIIPMCIVTILAIISSIFFYQTTEIKDITLSIKRFLEYGATYCIAYYCVYIFGEKIIRLFLISGWISYITLIITMVFNYGIVNTLTIGRSDAINGYTLEIHTFTYCMGLILLYLALFYKFKEYKLIILLLVGIILGYKRALILGLLFSIFIYLSFSKLKDNANIIFKLLVWLYIVLSIFFLFSIKSGLLVKIFDYFNINDMYRFNYWNIFVDDYKISFDYLGRGISYTDNIMGDTNVLSMLKKRTSAPIHNDIMQSYIGWGFVPFIYYYYNLLMTQTQKFYKNGNKELSWIYFSIISCCFIIYFFDHMLTTPSFNICFFTLWCLINKRRKRIEVN